MRATALWGPRHGPAPGYGDFTTRFDPQFQEDCPRCESITCQCEKIDAERRDVALELVDCYEALSSPDLCIPAEEVCADIERLKAQYLALSLDLALEEDEEDFRFPSGHYRITYHRKRKTVEFQQCN
jgi:hypothetical protein